MRFVPTAAVYPHRCAALPQIGANHPDGYIDTGSEMLPGGLDQRVQISVVAVREMARLIGWVPSEELEALQETVDRLAARVDELEGELSDAETVIDAVHVLKAKGYSAQRKPGPRAKAA